jgi:hypothetical protein
MSQTATFWQKYGTLAQMAQASVALLGFVAVLFQINAINSGIIPPECKLRKT